MGKNAPNLWCVALLFSGVLLECIILTCQKNNVTSISTHSTYLFHFYFYIYTRSWIMLFARNILSFRSLAPDLIRFVCIATWFVECIPSVGVVCIKWHRIIYSLKPFFSLQIVVNAVKTLTLLNLKYFLIMQNDSNARTEDKRCLNCVWSALWNFTNRLFSNNPVHRAFSIFYSPIIFMAKEIHSLAFYASISSIFFSFSRNYLHYFRNMSFVTPS